MAAGEGLTIEPASRAEQRRRFAHWIALGAAIGFVVLGSVGEKIARSATYPVCTGSTPPVAGGNLLVIALLVVAPVTVLAGVVSLVRGPRRVVSVIASIGAIAVVLLFFGHYWLEFVDWSQGCGY
jgi:hypothetical protein